MEYIGMAVSRCVRACVRVCVGACAYDPMHLRLYRQEAMTTSFSDAGAILRSGRYGYL